MSPDELGAAIRRGLTETEARKVFKLVFGVAGSMRQLDRWRKEDKMSSTRTRGPTFQADENLLELAEVLQSMWGGENKLSSHAAIEKVVNLYRLVGKTEGLGLDDDEGHIAMARLRNKVYSDKRRPPIQRGETALTVLLGGKRNAMVAMLRAFDKRYPQLELLP